MPKTMKVGLVGLDTSHVVAFCQLLNDPKHPYHVPGTRVVAGFPGGSPDMDVSRNRVEGFTKQLRDEFKVEILDSPEAVAERVDLVFITAVDGRAHRGYFDRTIGFKRPTFIDKPFATTLADAKAMLDGARQAGVPLMTCSSLRFAEPFTQAMGQAEPGPVLGADTFGPMEIRPPLEGLFWYGVHCVEMLVAAMGPGCRRVQALANKDFDLVTAEWADGRVGTLRGIRRGQGGFGVLLHREKAHQWVDIQSSQKPYYAGMLEAIVGSLPNGRSAVPPEEALTAVKLMLAANESRQSGRAVELAG